MLKSRRTFLFQGCGAALGLTACATPAIQTANTDGTYCYSTGKSYRPTRTCTTDPVPSNTTETDVKRFEAEADALTVFVFRRTWRDSTLAVPVIIDKAISALTIPNSLLRLRLMPGMHELVVEWDGGRSMIVIRGDAGSRHFVELIRSGLDWSPKFGWDRSPRASFKARAAACKLVADIDLRQRPRMPLGFGSTSSDRLAVKNG